MVQKLGVKLVRLFWKKSLIWSNQKSFPYADSLLIKNILSVLKTAQYSSGNHDLAMSLMSLLIHLMHPCWIKAFISFNNYKIVLAPNIRTVLDVSLTRCTSDPVKSKLVHLQCLFFVWKMKCHFQHIWNNEWTAFWDGKDILTFGIKWEMLLFC